MKKFACIVLAVLMLTLLSAGCKKKTNGNTTDTSPSETEDRRYLDDVPESVHFNGEEIRFAVCEAQNGTFSERSLGIEDYAGNKLDEEVHKRNLVIEQRLGLYIKIEQITGYKNFTDTVTPVLFSGTDAYDILMGAQYFDVALASKGYLLDINTLAADGHGYINTDKAYWPTEYINELNYKDKLYWVTGDISLRYTSGIYCTFVNKSMYVDYVEPVFGNLFDTVRDGEWDFGKMAEMGRAAYLDLNNNSQCDADDRIGLLVETGNSSTKSALAVGAGVSWSQKNENGVPQLTFNTSNGHLVDVIQALYGIFNSDYIYMPGNSDDDTAMKLFAQGNALFAMTKFYNAEVYLTDMEEDYYVIPMPKYERGQDGYRTLLHDGVNVFGISYVSSRKAACAALLEVMASESYRTVVPVYYDEVLKYRYTTDPDSSSMIDEIRNGIYVDFVLAWDRQITENWLRVSITNNPTSTLKRFQNGWQTNLDNLLLAFEKPATDQ